jgi:hypothetical protein
MSPPRLASGSFARREVDRSNDLAGLVSAGTGAAMGVDDGDAASAGDAGGHRSRHRLIDPPP